MAFDPTKLAEPVKAFDPADHAKPAGDFSPESLAQPVGRTLGEHAKDIATAGPLRRAFGLDVENILKPGKSIAQQAEDFSERRADQASTLVPGVPVREDFVRGRQADLLKGKGIEPEVGVIQRTDEAIVQDDDFLKRAVRVDNALTRPKQDVELGFGGTLKEGAKATLRAVGAVKSLAEGANINLRDLQDAQNNQQRDFRLENLMEDIDARTAALGDDESWMSTISEVAKAFAENPAGAGLLVTEQTPNSLVPLATGAIGLKAGLLGGVAGLFAGNITLETGFRALEKFGEESSGEIAAKGAIKGSVIGAVDTATIGLTGLIMNTTRRAVESATKTALINSGLRAGDPATLQKALFDPVVREQVHAAQVAAMQASQRLHKRAIRGGAATFLESFGEGLGEYLGSLAADGEASKVEAVIEAFSSVGASAATAGAIAAYNQKDLLFAREESQAVESAKEEIRADLRSDIPEDFSTAAAPGPTSIDMTEEEMRVAEAQEFNLNTDLSLIPDDPSAVVDIKGLDTAMLDPVFRQPGNLEQEMQLQLQNDIDGGTSEAVAKRRLLEIFPEATPMSQRRIGFSTVPEQIGLSLSKIKIPEGGTVVVGGHDDNFSTAYTQALGETIAQWQKDFLPEGEKIVVNLSGLTGGAVGAYQQLESGVHVISPRELPRSHMAEKLIQSGMSLEPNLKDGRGFNTFTQQQTFGALTHEFGHAVVMSRFGLRMPANLKNVVGMLDSGKNPSEKALVQMPEEEQAVVRDYLDKKKRVLSGEMTAEELMLDWVGPWKLGKDILKRQNQSLMTFAQKALEREGKLFDDTTISSRPLNQVSALELIHAMGRQAELQREEGSDGAFRLRPVTPTAEQVTKSNQEAEAYYLQFSEFMAEQFSRYAEMKKIDQGTAIGRYFARALKALRDFFKRLKAVDGRTGEDILKPGESFQKWMDVGYEPVAVKQAKVAEKKAKVEKAQTVRKEKAKKEATVSKAKVKAKPTGTRDEKWLKALVEDVVSVAKDPKVGRFDKNNVYIANVWKQLVADGKDRGLTPRDFKMQLTKAYEQDLLDLARADQTYIHTQGDVAASETPYKKTNFHFISLEESPAAATTEPKVAEPSIKDMLADVIAEVKEEETKALQSVDPDDILMSLPNDFAVIPADDTRNFKLEVHTHFVTTRDYEHEIFWIEEKRIISKVKAKVVAVARAVGVAPSNKNITVLSREIFEKLQTYNEGRPVHVLPKEKVLSEQQGRREFAEKKAKKMQKTPEKQAVVDLELAGDILIRVADTIPDVGDPARVRIEELIALGRLEEADYELTEHIVRELKLDRDSARSPRQKASDLNISTDSPDAKAAVKVLEKIGDRANASLFRKAINWTKDAAHYVLQIQQLAHESTDEGTLAFNEYQNRLLALKNNLLQKGTEVAEAWEKLPRKDYETLNKMLMDEFTSGQHQTQLMQDPGTGQWRHAHGIEFLEFIDKYGVDLSTARGEQLAKLFLDYKNSILQHIQATESIALSISSDKFRKAPALAKKKEAEIRSMAQKWRESPFVPQGHFGEYAIKVYEGSGDNKKMVYRTHFDNAADQDAMVKQMIKAGVRKDDISWGRLERTVGAQLVLPTEFITVLKDSGEFTSEQLERIGEAMIPLRGSKTFNRFTQASMRIAGASQDQLRNYANWIEDSANFLSKFAYGRKMTKARAVTKSEMAALKSVGRVDEARAKQRLLDTMTKAQEFIMHPLEEWYRARSFIALTYLVWAPKTALLNLTGLMQTWAAVTADYGDIKGNAILAGVMKDLTTNNLSFDEQWVKDRALRDGIIDQGFGYFMSGLANAGNLSRRLRPTIAGRAARAFVDLGMWPFKAVEVANRQMTLMSVYRAERDIMLKQGFGPEDAMRQAYDKASRFTRLLQNDYANGNRPEVLRGKKSILMIFLSYPQYMLWIMSGGFERGTRLAQIRQGQKPRGKFGGMTMRMWLLFAALAGTEGVPFGEFMISLIQRMMKIFGMNENIRLEGHRFMKETLGIEDRYWRDVIQRGFLHDVLGTDLSGSLSLGAPLPGLRLIDPHARNWQEFVGEAFGELSGPFGGAVKAPIALGLTDNPTAGDVGKALPAAPGAVFRAIEAGKRNVRTNQRVRILRDDDGNLREPTKTEIALIAAGFRLSEVARYQETNYLKRERREYWGGRRTGLKQQFRRAVEDDDLELQRDVLKEVDEYNAEIPSRGLFLSFKELRQFTRTSARKIRREEAGQHSKRDREIFQDVEQVLE